jgi:hypothetical protein
MTEHELTDLFVLYLIHIDCASLLSNKLFWGYFKLTPDNIVIITYTTVYALEGVMTPIHIASNWTATCLNIYIMFIFLKAAWQCKSP